MTEQLAPPVLSTPETNIFEDPTAQSLTPRSQRLSDEQLRNVYEIERTAKEIASGPWSRVALQFPDSMLHDSPRVFELLESTLSSIPRKIIRSFEEVVQGLDIAKQNAKPRNSRTRLSILADTSYGACCVDEIAAEHVDAEVVVHYGRSCLSPTARLPVIYVFTKHELALDPVVTSFEDVFQQHDTKIVLMADVTYSDHLENLAEILRGKGYENIYMPDIIHDPTSPIPNRTVPPTISLGEDTLSSYQLFHVSDPPPALLLTLSSRLQSIYIYPTDSSSPTPSALQSQTSRTLMRRYAVLTALSTCPTFGILVNTLSVKNYLPTIASIQKQIAAKGKKSYTFVVGKVNAAKVANFSEIGGWVVVGCWESSLIESKDFYRPIITPFELSLALQSDDERVWTGEWKSDFNGVFADDITPVTRERTEDDSARGGDGSEDEEDSAPPEYDLRTGRYVSHSRPMRQGASKMSSTASSSQALLKRVNGDIAVINGTASPGAEYLRSQRTWQGLGSDFEIKYDEEKGATVEEGRSGVARGYTIGEDLDKH